MKRFIMMFSSISLLALGAGLLIADSAEPPLDCEGTYVFEQEYDFTISCEHQNENLTYEGTTFIYADGPNNLSMDSDLPEISFDLLNTTDFDHSCEDRADKKKYIQTIFYTLEINDETRNIRAGLECSSFDVMLKDTLISEERTRSCELSKVFTDHELTTLNCQIKLQLK